MTRRAHRRVTRRGSRTTVLRVTWAAAFALVFACGPAVEARLAEARTRQARGDFAGSIEPLRAILDRAPDQAEANVLLGAALLQTGEPSLAVLPLERAARSPERATDAAALLVAAYLATEAWEEATSATDRVLAARPDDAAALYARGHARLALGEPERALADADHLVAVQPDGYSGLFLRAAVLWDLKRFDDAERAYTRLAEAAAAADPATARKGRLALAGYHGERGDVARATEEYDAIVAADPTDPLALSLATQFYDASGRPERATEILRAAVAAAPESVPLRTSLAGRLSAAGERDAAVALLEESATRQDTRDAWLALADLHARLGDRDAAAQAIDRAAQHAASGDDALGFKRSQLLADAGRLDAATAAAREIGEPLYRDLALGRILLDRGDAPGALQKLDAGVRRWPNNGAARYLTGRAAFALGDFDRAASEWREAVRVAPELGAASLALAQLELARGEPVLAAEFARRRLAGTKPGHGASAAQGVESDEAALVLARALSRQGDLGAAHRALAPLDGRPDLAARVALVRAELARRAGGPAAAAAALEASGVDVTAATNEAVLRVLCDDLLAAGRSADALARVDAALAGAPDTAALHDVRGRVLAGAGRTDDARTEFERALALAPEHAPAVAGLATLAIQAGDPAGALALWERAALAAPGETDYAYPVAQLLLAAGRRADAEADLRKIVRRDPGAAFARNDLAWLLIEDGRELDLALALARDASRIAPTPDVIDTLGLAQLRSGDAASAVRTLTQAVAAHPDSAGLRRRLGQALAASGDREGALRELRAAVATGTLSDADAARDEIARLERAGAGS